MINKALIKRLRLTILLLVLSPATFSQTQTTGRVTGTIVDPRNAAIAGAIVSLTDEAIGTVRTIISDGSGNYTFALLPPGIYRLRVSATGFDSFTHAPVYVSITETTKFDVVLNLAGVQVDAGMIYAIPLQLRFDSAVRSNVIDERTMGGIPLATRNVTQLLSLVPGTTTYLTDNTVVGRNSQNFSVNGSRFSQNNIQINGIDANAGLSFSLPLANPAPESISEVTIQTSLYDASYGRSGGGNIQIVTRSGSNEFHGSVYDYFRNTALNANNPYLKAVGAKRPDLDRNIFGVMIGGPIKTDRAFFFGSYQTTRERNGASRLNSLSVNVLVDSRLTDDRSDADLTQTFGPIHGSSLRLLQAKLPNGRFLIPSPNLGARYIGSAISRFAEEQFNANLDVRLGREDLLSIKFFFSDSPAYLARSGAINVPGFGTDQEATNRLLSIRHIHNINAKMINEFRAGYNFTRNDNLRPQPFGGDDFGIERSTFDEHPGLPAITINSASGGVSFGTGALLGAQSTAPVTTLSDTVSIIHDQHTFRIGGEVRYYEFNSTNNALTRGAIAFANFEQFVRGATNSGALANGIRSRSFRATDYNMFVQDDWKLTPKLTVNLGLRYELDLPPFDTRGRYSTFDPELYSPRLDPVTGPPAGGIVQAVNVIPEYDTLNIPKVSKRLLKSNDLNNFAPRIGIAYSPSGGRTVLRGGYGIFYSRSSFQSVVNTLFSTPFYTLRSNGTGDLSHPFPDISSESQFPDLSVGLPLFGNTLDRNNRTPYVHQYNAGVQLALSSSMVLDASYVGTRGVKLLRQIAINQARLVPINGQIDNGVTPPVTTNLASPGNVSQRAPFQGTALGSGFLQDQTSGSSQYNSLQMSLTQRLSKGISFLASYTLGRSVDDGSGLGGGAATNGLINTAQVGDTSSIVGNQLDNRSNRGVSDFDRTHRFTMSFTWMLPTKGKWLFSGWQLSGIVTAMSGLPIDIVDTGAATFYFGQNGGGARPNWSGRISPFQDVPAGLYFNPAAFARPIVAANQFIPSSNFTAIAHGPGTDFGNVERNALRGPAQFNTDLAISRRFTFSESKYLEVRSESFNLFNQVNYANPISNLAAQDFGKIISTSNNPRIIQLAVRFGF